MELMLRKDMVAIRRRALERLDETMRRRRQALLGPNADVHAEKAAEAESILSGRGQAPLLEAEALATDRTTVGVAREVLAKRQAQMPDVAALEVDRQRVQDLIRDAATPAMVEAAIAELEG